MNKINIANIISVPVEQVVGVIGTETNINESVRSKIDDVLRLNKERRDNKQKIYRSLLKGCVEKIRQQNILRKTETTYTVEDIVYGHPEYDREECIEYMINSLRKYNVCVCLLNKTTLFLYWKFMEFQNQ